MLNSRFYYHRRRGRRAHMAARVPFLTARFGGYYHFWPPAAVDNVRANCMLSLLQNCSPSYRIFLVSCNDKGIIVLCIVQRVPSIQTSLAPTSLGGIACLMLVQ